MSSLTLNDSQIQQLDALNSVFEAAEPRLSKILTFDNFVNEAHALRVIESRIPESLRFDLHLDMILSKGITSVTDYYQSMSTGTNYILEAARKILPNSPAITESIESFKEYLGSMLTEESLALSMPTGMSSGSADTALAGGALQPRGGGFWGTLKSLWNAITEGGSVIGIVHFIIDIIGLVGDFIFPGVGVVADIINAIIYAIRGEWLMCAISVIAAVVIGGGDALKLLKGAVKPSEKVLVALTKEGGSKQAAEMLSKMPAKEKGGVVKLLTGIFGNLGGALGKATSLFGRFISSFGKVTGYIPGLGGALKWVFDGLGKTLTKFGQKMTLCSANFKLATAASKKAAAATIDATLKGGGDFVFDGPWVKIFNKEGKQVGKYPTKQFDKISGEALANITAKKAGSKEASKILYKNGDDVAKVTKTLESPAVNASMRKRAYSFFNTTPFWKGSKRFVKDLPFFLGKQIYKLIFGTPWVDGESSKWSKREVEGHGNGAFNNWISDRLEEEKNKTGAVYVPALMLDSDDQEVVDKVTDYQNHFAKLYGEREVMHVVTKQYDKNGPGAEFADFFDQIAKGEVTRGGKGDMVDHTTADELNVKSKLTESKKTIVRKVSNFSDFNK
jgi:hypothetical protein